VLCLPALRHLKQLVSHLPTVPHKAQRVARAGSEDFAPAFVRIFSALAWRESAGSGLILLYCFASISQPQRHPTQCLSWHRRTQRALKNAHSSASHLIHLLFCRQLHSLQCYRWPCRVHTSHSCSFGSSSVFHTCDRLCFVALRRSSPRTTKKAEHPHSLESGSWPRHWLSGRRIPARVCHNSRRKQRAASSRPRAKPI